MWPAERSPLAREPVHSSLARLFRLFLSWILPGLGGAFGLFRDCHDCQWDRFDSHLSLPDFGGGSSAFDCRLAGSHRGVRFFGLSRGVFRYLERLASHAVNFRLLARLRVWFYQHIEPLSPAILLHTSSGDLLTRVVADIDTLENFYIRAVAPPVVALLSMVGLACILVFRSEAGLLVGGIFLPGRRRFTPGGTPAKSRPRKRMAGAT